MIPFFIRGLKWMFCVGVAAWFFILPVLPIYGAFRPWPEATAAIRNHGIQGALLMIGAGVDYESTDGEVISNSRQRTYLAVPDSFTSGNVFIFSKGSPTAVHPERVTLTVERVLPVLLTLWIAAGLFVIWIAVKSKNMRTGKG
jgi:hypothetical protein